MNLALLRESTLRGLLPSLLLPGFPFALIHWLLGYRVQIMPHGLAVTILIIAANIFFTWVTLSLFPKLRSSTTTQ